MALLVLVDLFALSAALALAYRHYAEKESETVTATFALWMIQIAVPTYTLGQFGLLTATNVAIATIAVSCAVLATALFRLPTDRSAHLKNAARAFLRLPLSGLCAAWRVRSIVSVGLLAIPMIALFTAYLSYLAPSCSWDGLWYHDSIVGFAIQNRGFEWVNVPRKLEYVNGYPKMSEMFSLHIVLLSGTKTLIEIVPSFMFCILFVGMYRLVRRFVDNTVHAMGWACVLVLLPAVVLELRSTLTDVTFTTGFVLSLYFMTRSNLRPVDLCIGAMLTGMMGTMKGTGFAIAPLLFALGAIRVIFTMKLPQALIMGGVILTTCGLLFAPTYLRNFVVHDNPFWPISYHIDFLGINFKGPWPLTLTRPNAIYEFFAPPLPNQARDTRDNGYGNIIPFVFPPLLLAGLIALAVDVFKKKRDETKRWLLLSLVVTLPSLLASPAVWWWARLNLHGVALAILMVARLLRSAKFRVLVEGCLGALIVGSIVTLYWSQPAWDIPLSRVAPLQGKSPFEREINPLKGTMPDHKTARARERELGEGTVVAYDGSYRFHANLWNSNFSNKVVYLGSADAKNFEQELNLLKAKWVVAAQNGPWDKKLARAIKHWQLVGHLGKSNVAYRRKGSPKK